MPGVLALETSVLQTILAAHCGAQSDIVTHMTRYFAIPVEAGDKILSQLIGISLQSSGMQFNRLNVLPTMQNLSIVLNCIVKRLAEYLSSNEKEGQLTLQELIFLHVGEEDRQAVLGASGFILSSPQVRAANSQTG